ncbi:PLDc N-terminal domain-containing protein [Streptomyces sp. NPDC004647]|uniref:PLDc N-terminal domain-containing protein n=1 Tax=Streptomyces sp. NPDC004647 TaxID=3154671 RepID=UPI0033BA4D00
MLRYLPFLLVLALWVYAFIDCLNTPENQVRKLPKGAWVMIIVLFGYLLFGSIAWLAAGRPRRAPAEGAPRPYSRGRSRWVAPDDNPDFLKSLDKNKDKDRGEGEGEETGSELDKDRDEDRGPDDNRP